MVEPRPLDSAANAAPTRTNPKARSRLISLVMSVVLALAMSSAAAQAGGPGAGEGAPVTGATLLVYPFDSQDVFLGVALADEVATALSGHALVIGPEAAPGAMPPVIVDGGFISIGRVLGAPLFMTPAGADVLRTGTGVDVAVTGSVELRDSGAYLRLSVAYEGGSRNADLRTEMATPERLAALAAALVRGIVDDVTGSRGETPVVLPSPPSLVGDFSNTPYGGYVRALALIGAGLLNDALVELTEAAGVDGAPARAEALRDDLQAVISGVHEGTVSGSRTIRRALLSVATSGTHLDAATDALDRMEDVSGMPVAAVWRGALAASVNDRSGAQAALDAGAEGFMYGRAVRASFLQARGSADFVTDVDAILTAGTGAGSAALLGVSLIADTAGDAERELEALTLLSRSAPFMAYPLDRLSHIYFDADDGRSAAEVLAVAVELEPDSDLYWTNLGWAYYLVGALEASEAASLRALALVGTQEVAAYNLGLVRAVTGRLQDAIPAYMQALRLDPAVNDEAIADLENARDLYPGEAGVDYALGVLYEAKGRRTDARRALERFVRLADSDESLAAFVEQARASLVALAAPLPPLVIEDGLSVTLGSRGVVASPFHPGDPVFPTFELTTPGDELPTDVDVVVTLVGPEAGAVPLATVEATLAIPAGAVGFVVDTVELTLPLDIAAGEYTVTLEVSGDEGQAATASTSLTVAGEPDLLRRLVGRSLVMTAFESGRPLYSAADLGTDRVTALLLQELQATADLAEDALPTVEGGRFSGLTGGQVFRDSTGEDVRDFLAYVLSSDARDSRFSFVDAYAQWAIDGAPAE